MRCLLDVRSFVFTGLLATRTPNSAFLLALCKKAAYMTQKRTFENRHVNKPEDMIRFNYCYS